MGVRLLNESIGRPCSFPVIVPNPLPIPMYPEEAHPHEPVVELWLDNELLAEVAAPVMPLQRRDEIVLRDPADSGSREFFRVTDISHEFFRERCGRGVLPITRIEVRRADPNERGGGSAPVRLRVKRRR